MSLTSMRNMFHNAGLGKWILGIVTAAMLVTAFTGIGATLGKNNGGANSGARGGAAGQQGPSSTIATVNGLPVSKLDFNMAYDQARQQSAMMGQQYPSPAEAVVIRQQALARAIEQAEEVLVAQQAGVTATSAEIDRQRNTELASVRQKLSLPPTASLDQINESLAPYNQTVNDLLPDSSISKEVVLSKYQSAMQRSTVASDADVQQYFRKVHTRHILISNKTHPDAQALQQAQQLITKIKGGADFATLAKQYSEDPGSKNSGGDDGFITVFTQYVPEFLLAALPLKTGEVTPEPVLSPQYGYFIIQAVAAQDETPKDFAKNKDQYAQQASQEKLGLLEKAALDKFQQNAKVTVNDPLLRAYWTLGQPNAQAGAAATRADLNTALASADYATKGEIYTVLAQLDASSNDTKAQIKDLNSALATTDDAQLRVALGQAYLKSGDTKSALQQFQTASSHAYSDPTVHEQLQQVYMQMKQTELAAGEVKWMQDYTKRQRQANAAQRSAGAMPGQEAVPVAAAPEVSAPGAKPSIKK